jgi:hypothetical protein
MLKYVIETTLEGWVINERDRQVIFDVIRLAVVFAEDLCHRGVRPAELPQQRMRGNTSSG